MTVSNGTVCMHPLANPFNTRLGYSNYTLNTFGLGNPFCKMTFNKSCTTLPQAKPLGSDCIPNNPNAQQVSYSNLQLPDTTIRASNLRSVLNKALFTAPDGTILDIDKQKVVSSPNSPKVMADGTEYWNDPNSQIVNTHIQDAYNSTYGQWASDYLGSSLLIQNSSDDYFKYAEKETPKLYAKMTQEQKDMLMEIPRMFPSRLIEVEDED